MWIIPSKAVKNYKTNKTPLTIPGVKEAIE